MCEVKVTDEELVLVARGMSLVLKDVIFPIELLGDSDEWTKLREFMEGFLQNKLEGRDNQELVALLDGGSMRWKGYLSKNKADVLLRAGVALRRCDTPSCRSFYQPWRKDQRYCSELCGRRERARVSAREARKAKKVTG